jgi:hypothetical protein
LHGKGSDEDYNQSLKFLCRCLELHHQKKVIILIDEYDVPLKSAWFGGFYPQMIAFIRSLFESALKTNPHLEFAVLTGCLRISKESIFTGLNNLKIISIQNREYAEYFGFTPGEVESMLHFYNLGHRLEDFQNWYNGYLFGDSVVYNPWSVINAVDDLKGYPDSFLKPYWANTSGNSIVRTLIDKADDDAKTDLDTLIAGGTIRKAIHEDITYLEMENSLDNIWNFLFFTGYLKKAGEHIEIEQICFDLNIPNREIKYIFVNKIRDWFNEKIEQKDLSSLYSAVLAGDSETFEAKLSELLLDSISFFDNQENFYHGFLVGVLSSAKGYIVKSNREGGNGRGDIFMKYRSFKGKAVVFELKVAASMKELAAKCDEALRQIDEKQYANELEQEGYQTILKYGIAFYKKDCMVKIMQTASRGC